MVSSTYSLRCSDPPVAGCLGLFPNQGGNQPVAPPRPAKQRATGSTAALAAASSTRSGGCSGWPSLTVSSPAASSHAIVAGALFSAAQQFLSLSIRPFQLPSFPFGGALATVSQPVPRRLPRRVLPGRLSGQGGSCLVSPAVRVRRQAGGPSAGTTALTRAGGASSAGPRYLGANIICRTPISRVTCPKWRYVVHSPTCSGGSPALSQTVGAAALDRLVQV